MLEDANSETPFCPDTEPSFELFSSLYTDAAEVSAAYKIKNSLFKFMSVYHSELEEKQASGWTVRKSYKTKAKIKREKRIDEKLEDRVWCMLKKMGYIKLNKDKFKIQFIRNNGTRGEKQIDAFACDDETAVVVECKSKQERGRRSLQKDILETKALQDYIRRAVFDGYGEKPKPKIIWLYATENIIWSTNDVDRASDSNINIVTENELQYFEAFLEHVGPAGKYQIIGEFLGGQKVSGMAAVRVPAIKGKIGGEECFSFITTPRNLLKISFINHQAFNRDDGKPAYQRMMTSKRLKDVASFIADGGYFPTNILINLMEKPRFDFIENKENTDPNIKFGWLTLPSKYRTAWIIDGQHRLYGYSHLDDKYLDQSLIVLAFNRMDTKKEASLFVNINSKQKSVPRSLLVSLLPDLKMGSADPKEALQAISSAIIRCLNLDKTSPFFRRFSMPGLPPEEGQNLTISEAVYGLLRSGLIGKIYNKIRLPSVLCAGTDDKTIERATKILNGYFEALYSSNPERWKDGRTAYISVNPGVRAHLLLISEIVKYLTSKKSIDFNTTNEQSFIEMLCEISQPVFDFVQSATAENIKEAFSRRFGEAGVKDYFFELCRLVQSKFDDFGSDEYRQHIKQRDEQRVAAANQLVIDINEKILDTLADGLKSIYGEKQLPSGEYTYWEKGIDSRVIKEKAYKKMQDDPIEEQMPKWAYLDILEVKTIVEQTSNWPYFENFFNIPMPGDRKGKKYYTSWLARFNELRRVPGHKSSVRTFSDEDLEFLDWLRAEFYPRLCR